MCQTCEEQTSEEILAYLVEHPEAQDTVEGIVEWWLLEQGLKRRAAAVKEALAELVASRYVVERQGRDERTHYRVNRRKMKEIRYVLGRRAGECGG